MAHGFITTVATSLCANRDDRPMASSRVIKFEKGGRWIINRIITIEPDKRGGKPCIRSMRITVYDVLGYLAPDRSVEEILSDVPDLTPEDIRACLAFAADRERRLMSVSSA